MLFSCPSPHPLNTPAQNKVTISSSSYHITHSPNPSIHPYPPHSPPLPTLNPPLSPPHRTQMVASSHKQMARRVRDKPVALPADAVSTCEQSNYPTTSPNVTGRDQLINSLGSTRHRCRGWSPPRCLRPFRSTLSHGTILFLPRRHTQYGGRGGPDECLVHVN